MKNIILLALVICLIGCGGDPENPKNNNNKIDGRVSKPISEYAYTEYSRDQFPKTYAQWGDDWISKISSFEKQVAQKIANESNACDSIEMVSLSDNKSTPKKEAVFFVDCANGERFYVSQNDLVEVQEIKSQAEKAISQSEALDSCIRMVKDNVKYPSSVNFKMLDSSGFTAKTTGNVVITLGFEAKNSLGAEVKAKARCIFTPDGESEVNIIES